MSLVHLGIDFSSIAEKISLKRKEHYSIVVNFLRRRYRFDLLKTFIIFMRGYKKAATKTENVEMLDLDCKM